MPGAYSADLRARVLQVCARGQLSRAKIAALFQVGKTTLYRWQQEWRAHRQREAKPHAGGPAPKLDAMALNKLKDLVVASNDLTLAEYAAKLAERAGVQVSGSTVCRALPKLGLPRKKDPASAVSRTGLISLRLGRVGVSLDRGAIKGQDRSAALGLFGRSTAALSRGSIPA